MSMGTLTRKPELNLAIQPTFSVGQLVNFRKHFQHRFLVFLNFYLTRGFKNTNHFAWRSLLLQIQSLHQMIQQMSTWFLLMMTKHMFQMMRVTMTLTHFSCLMSLSSSKMGKVSSSSDVSWTTHHWQSIDAQDLYWEWNQTICWCHPSFITQCTGHWHNSSYSWPICDRTSKVNMSTNRTNIKSRDSWWLSACIYGLAFQNESSSISGNDYSCWTKKDQREVHLDQISIANLHVMHFWYISLKTMAYERQKDHTAWFAKRVMAHRANALAWIKWSLSNQDLFHKWLGFYQIFAFEGPWLLLITSCHNPVSMVWIGGDLLRCN